jgi:hypothetical protein
MQVQTNKTEQLLDEVDILKHTPSRFREAGHGRTGYWYWLREVLIGIFTSVDLLSSVMWCDNP